MQWSSEGHLLTVDGKDTKQKESNLCLIILSEQLNEPSLTLWFEI